MKFIALLTIVAIFSQVVLAESDPKLKLSKKLKSTCKRQIDSKRHHDEKLMKECLNSEVSCQYNSNASLCLQVAITKYKKSADPSRCFGLGEPLESKCKASETSCRKLESDSEERVQCIAQVDKKFALRR